MNSTNRGTNRLVIVVTGLVVLLLGAVAIALGTPTSIRAGWHDGAAQTTATITGWLQQTPLGGPGTSWLWLVGLAVLVVLIVALTVFISRQGGGHTSTLVSAPGRSAPSQVSTMSQVSQVSATLESGVAVDVLQDALAGRPEFVTSSVSTYRVKKQSVLKIAVTCRRGVSPADVAATISRLLRDLDTLLGVELPAFVQIGGGFRAKVSRATRLQ